MSWNFKWQQLNEQFDRIALWYRDFMDRCRIGFERVQQQLARIEQRLARLEHRQDSQPPTDEQLERVLRKVLAERFGNEPQGSLKPAKPREEPPLFLPASEDSLVPKPIDMQGGFIPIQPDSVPGPAYIREMERLSSDLEDFPPIIKTEEHHHSPNGTASLA